MSNEIGTDVIQKTQSMLGKIIKKPPLTDKLLMKPPFRFLHDVIKAVIKETGFLKGLFTESELNSDNVKEKEAKVAFLNKLITAVKTITEAELDVRASKIVAGIEPVKTNMLLQRIAYAVEKKMDSTEYVKSVNGKSNGDKKKLTKSPDDKEEKAKKSIKKKSDSDKKSTDRKVKKSPLSTPKSTDRSSVSKESKVKKSKKAVDKDKEAKSKTLKIKTEQISPEMKINESDKVGTDVPDKPEDTERVDSVQSKSSSVPAKEIINKDAEQNNIESKVDVPVVVKKPEEVEEPKEVQGKDTEVKKRQGSAGLIRPKSARPKSAERDNVASAKVRKIQESSAPIEMKTSAPSVQRPKTSLRPPSVRPSSARPGAPRLRPDTSLPSEEVVTMGTINVIVENVDTDTIDEEETTVVIQADDDLMGDELPPALTELKVPDENKGHLVEQILKQIEEEGEDTKNKVDIDWEEDANRGKDVVNKEIFQLRSLIQNLTKTANPLGKLLSYLHEDFDAMHNELQVWTNIKKELRIEIDKQKKITDESNKPLYAHLEHIQDEIKKQEEEILNLRGIILKNDMRIKDLLTK